MRNQGEENIRRNRARRFTNCWFLLPLIVGAIGIAVVTTFSIFSSRIKETMGKTTIDTTDMALSLIISKLPPLAQANRSAFSVAGALRLASNVNGSFSHVSSQVMPRLFLAYTMQPSLAQVSYAGLNGMAFSYYHAEDGSTRALFSKCWGAWRWYSQAVDPTTGDLLGDAVVAACRPSLANMTRVLLESKAGSYASLGAGWARPEQRMLFFSVPVGDAGVVLTAIAVKDVVDAVLSIDLHGMQLYYAMDDNSLNAYGPLLAVSPKDGMDVFSYANCPRSSIDAPKFELLDVGSNKYRAACADIDISGVRLVLGLVHPYKHIAHMFQEMNMTTIFLVLSMVVLVVVVSYFMVRELKRCMAQEALLCAKLVRQKEALQQAERKSMNKSNVLAGASHDIRSALAAIAGMIDVCRSEAQTHADMMHNLEQMDVCTKKLLEILNSILDTSKVESGKMQLEEVEFSLPAVLEESVDMINVVGVGKGIEVIWDPCDFSVLKCGNVRGDCRRLKQILDNLLGNAVKFTQEGYVILRAWANRPITRSSNVPFVCPRSYHTFFRLFSARHSCIEPPRTSSNRIQNDPDSIEFYFEVDDTGVGIPKEKRDSVFENYVQVKEGHGGTGLGLGIVQSFVRLMGGEISIQEKELGEGGTCFGFNVFLKSTRTEEEEAGASTRSVDTADSDAQALSFRRVPSYGGVHCVLYVEGRETRRILQDWMENLGVKVWMTTHVKHLACTLDKARRSITSQARTPSPSLDCGAELCFSAKDTVSPILPIATVNNGFSSERFNLEGGHPSGVLVVVDLSVDKLEDIRAETKSIAETKHQVPCKVVCLTDLKSSSGDLTWFRQTFCDHALRKPVHGSRLHALMGILKDLSQGSHARHPSQAGRGNATASTETALPATSQPEIVEDDKPFAGMRFLLVEDTLVLQNIEKRMLTQLGAAVDVAENGAEAVRMVEKALVQATFPYDVVFMDCQMPVMNGYEATRRIREEESMYGRHVPIVALTAHASEEELQKTILAGMDLHLTKPVDRRNVIEAVRRIGGDRRGRCPSPSHPLHRPVVA